MWWGLIPVAVGVIVGSLCVRSLRSDGYEYSLVSPFLVVFTIFTAFTGLILGPAFSESRSGDTVALVALSNNSEMEGSFFLGSGTIDDKQVFTYMAETEEGGYVLREINTNYATVFEDDNPRIEWLDDCVSFFPWWDICLTERNANIYIPEGSIYRGYDIDVRNGS